MSENRPLDVLEGAVGQNVAVLLKGGDRFAGELVGFDQHMNLVLDPPLSADEPATETPDSAGESLEGVDNTTVIRGDNLVSIEP
jgi:small nuclear ribonucleoprotein (snRNP)-like protein